jgi:hypothetical protein
MRVGVMSAVVITGEEYGGKLSTGTAVEGSILPDWHAAAPLDWPDQSCTLAPPNPHGWHVYQYELREMVSVRVLATHARDLPRRQLARAAATV